MASVGIDPTTSREVGATGFIVEFDGPQDPHNPQNWPMRRTNFNVAPYIFATLAATFASADLSSSVKVIGSHFHISPEVATLAAATLFLCGFGLGPAIWAPLSEVKGRTLPARMAVFGLMVFAAGGANARDVQTLMLCRFFQGLMGSGPLVVGPGVIADSFKPLHRGYALACFGAVVFTGPMLAPFVAGFTLQNGSLGWRWNVWWGFFLALASLLCLLFVSSESYVPVILTNKAAVKRHDTRNYAWHSRHEEVQVSLRDFAAKYLKKPIIMMATEPILFCVSLYTAFVYALLYTFLTSYGIVFRNGYGMNLGISGFPLFGLIFGLMLGTLAFVSAQPRLNRLVIQHKGVYTPEWLMPLCMTGAVAFPVGLFWFGWTGAYPHSVHWIVPTLSGIFTGYGLIMIFSTSFTYLIVVYKQNSAMAFGANTMIRSALAAGFPMFATQLFDNLGVQWANTLLGCLAVVLAPVPVIFYLYGAKIRARSKWVPKEL
ncbi:hypothetical protein ANO11243_027190 [Dothideomycetidae sp. 11243]|nr:hypothetical protein ANO11243_027190 [fungal sp. No.11243]